MNKLLSKLIPLVLCVAMLAGCTPVSTMPEENTFSFTDDLGREVASANRCPHW